MASPTYPNLPIMLNLIIHDISQASVRLFPDWYAFLSLRLLRRRAGYFILLHAAVLIKGFIWTIDLAAGYLLPAT